MFRFKLYKMLVMLYPLGVGVMGRGSETVTTSSGLRFKLFNLTL